MSIVFPKTDLVKPKSWHFYVAIILAPLVVISYFFITISVTSISASQSIGVPITQEGPLLVMVTQTSTYALIFGTGFGLTILIGYLVVLVLMLMAIGSLLVFFIRGLKGYEEALKPAFFSFILADITILGLIIITFATNIYAHFNFFDIQIGISYVVFLSLLFAVVGTYATWIVKNRPYIVVVDGKQQIDNAQYTCGSCGAAHWGHGNCPKCGLLAKRIEDND